MKAARDYPILTVTAKGTRWLESGHPWVYDSDVAREPDESECENGALVDVVSEKGKYLGTGFLSRLSKLRVRIVSRNANDRFDENFWRRRVRYAWDYRKAVMDGQTGCCRLIFGEADAFPGLTVDRFENLLVTQTLSLGMEKIKDMLFPLIVEVLEQDGETIDGLFERNDVVLREKEGLTQNKGWFPLPGKKMPESPITEICENGVFYRVDVENGQKTGFFLDQKFNRLAVAHLAHGKRVLDCFTHTGSFALNAAKGGAEHVTAVDVSESAIEMARANAARNGLEDKMDFLAADVFDLLPQLEAAHEKPYDFIILDPPAFTKSRRTANNAARRTTPKRGTRRSTCARCACCRAAATLRPRRAATSCPPNALSGCCAPPPRTRASSCGRSKRARRAVTTPSSGTCRRRITSSSTYSKWYKLI